MPFFTEAIVSNRIGQKKKLVKWKRYSFFSKTCFVQSFLHCQA